MLPRNDTDSQARYRRNVTTRSASRDGDLGRATSGQDIVQQVVTFTHLITPDRDECGPVDPLGIPGRFFSPLSMYR